MLQCLLAQSHPFFIGWFQLQGLSDEPQRLLRQISRSQRLQRSPRLGQQPSHLYRPLLVCLDLLPQLQRFGIARRQGQRPPTVFQRPDVIPHSQCLLRFSQQPFCLAQPLLLFQHFPFELRRFEVVLVNRQHPLQRGQGLGVADGFLVLPSLGYQRRHPLSVGLSRPSLLQGRLHLPLVLLWCYPQVLLQQTDRLRQLPSIAIPQVEASQLQLLSPAMEFSLPLSNALVETVQLPVLGFQLSQSVGLDAGLFVVLIFQRLAHPGRRVTDQPVTIAPRLGLLLQAEGFRVCLIQGQGLLTLLDHLIEALVLQRLASGLQESLGFAERSLRCLGLLFQLQSQCVLRGFLQRLAQVSQRSLVVPNLQSDLGLSQQGFQLLLRLGPLFRLLEAILNLAILRIQIQRSPVS